MASQRAVASLFRDAAASQLEVPYNIHIWTIHRLYLSHVRVYTCRLYNALQHTHTHTFMRTHWQISFHFNLIPARTSAAQ